MKSALVTTLLLAAAVACFAQKRNTYYLKNDGRYVETRDSADFIRIVQEPDSGSALYNVFDLYKDGSRKLIGKSSRIKPVVFEGQVAQFYPNGKKMQVANYRDNRLSGLFYQYHPNGKIFSVVQYQETSDGNKGSYFILSCVDSAGHELVKEGNGHYKGLDGGGDGIMEEGNVSGAMRDGDWKGSVASPGITFQEHYEHGALISGSATDKAGNIHNYTQRLAHTYYRDGNKALFTFLINQINFLGKDGIANINGTAVIQFALDARNNMSDIRILNSVNETTSRYLEQAMQMSAKHWVPAMYFGIPRKEYYSFRYSLKTEDATAFF